MRRCALRTSSTLISIAICVGKPSAFTPLRAARSVSRDRLAGQFGPNRRNYLDILSYIPPEQPQPYIGRLLEKGVDRSLSSRRPDF
jgi:hypothetical protein